MAPTRTRGSGRLRVAHRRLRTLIDQDARGVLRHDVDHCCCRAGQVGQQSVIDSRMHWLLGDRVIEATIVSSVLVDPENARRDGDPGEVA